MSWLQLILTILTVMALSAGQVLFKLASEDLKLSVGGLLPSLLSIKLILALFIYGIATVMWLIVLKIAPLRIAYPFIAMAFIFVPILAYFILGEELRWSTFAGALLIIAGVWVSVIR